MTLNVIFFIKLQKCLSYLTWPQTSTEDFRPLFIFLRMINTQEQDPVNPQQDYFQKWLHLEIFISLLVLPF